MVRVVRDRDDANDWYYRQADEDDSEWEEIPEPLWETYQNSRASYTDAYKMVRHYIDSR
jgi:hypothetical protein